MSIWVHSRLWAPTPWKTTLAFEAALCSVSERWFHSPRANEDLCSSSGLQQLALMHMGRGQLWWQMGQAEPLMWPWEMSSLRGLPASQFPGQHVSRSSWRSWIMFCYGLASTVGRITTDRTGTDFLMKRSGHRVALRIEIVLPPWNSQINKTKTQTYYCKLYYI